ncbi:MAG TPA: hypothetical protein VLB50_10485 [Ignavibacteriaceae bacterium]|nr:hypothetical protein [Ignavibacteriaceae bacterium]
MIIKKIIVTVVLFILLWPGIDQCQVSKSVSLVNPSHLDALYEEINIEGRSMGIIHIYSNYPDYKWVGDEDEGIACVDDAARAAIFYLRNYRDEKDTNSLIKSEGLLEFLLYMQSDNGYFYNFLLEDHSINKTHQNSVNGPSWWSWRAMWALSEGYKILKDVNPALTLSIKTTLVKSVEAVKHDFTSEKVTGTIKGIEFPSWLPAESAADQAAVLVLALLNYYEETNDNAVVNYINNLCDGILMMQKGSSSEIPFNAFLSWQNIWHAYGNSQSYALLKASKILQRTELQTAALNEVDNFYDYSFKSNNLSSFELEKEGDSLRFAKKNNFPQIAYNFRPMIFACLEAFAQTDDSVYAQKSADISGWFFGYNISCAEMYDYSTGICFDGIDAQGDINMNSGAESTIEALLSMQMLEEYPIVKENLLKKYF